MHGVPCELVGLYKIGAVALTTCIGVHPAPGSTWWTRSLPIYLTLSIECHTPCVTDVHDWVPTCESAAMQGSHVKVCLHSCPRVTGSMHGSPAPLVRLRYAGRGTWSTKYYITRVLGLPGNISFRYLVHQVPSCPGQFIWPTLQPSRHPWRPWHGWTPSVRLSGHSSCSI